MESHLLVSFFSSVSCATGSFCLGTTIAPLASCLDSQSVPHTAAAYLKPKPDPVTPLINPSRTSCDVKDQDITPSHSGSWSRVWPVLAPTLIPSIPLSLLAPHMLAPAVPSTDTPGSLLGPLATLVTLPVFFSLLALRRPTSFPPFHLFHS